MGAGMGGPEDGVGGGPAWLAPSGLFHTVGASLGLGRFWVSGVEGMRTTPEGKPEVVGVGACPWAIAPAASTASKTAAARVPELLSDSTKRAPPTASQSPTKN